MNRPNSITVLVVDDDADMRDLLVALLASEDIATVQAASAQEATSLLEEEPVDLVLTDLVMPNTDGLELLSEIRKAYQTVPVVMMTAHGTVETAVRAMKAGASDYVLKPLDRDELMFAINKCITASRQRNQVDVEGSAPGSLLGDSACMQACYGLIRKAARGQATVLLRGESGTGKELAARAIHDESSLSAGTFVKVHCAALPDTLLESELFGYEKGAFTGAVQRKPGRVDLASGGTLFLDEIGDITPALQVKLLRLLQDREYERLGGTQTLTADVRFVAATHRDLESMVAAGEFREDLFYRLNVIPITLPPLRARLDDVPLLARHFFAAMIETHRLPDLRLADDALERLAAHAWPGNVRQLVNVIERLVVLSEGEVVMLSDVEHQLQAAAVLRAPAAEELTPQAEPSTHEPLKQHRDEAERNAIERALERAKYNRTVAARILGVSRRTLYNKLKSFGMLGRRN